MNHKKALIIDGNSMFYRMYYATMNQVDFALQNGWTPNNAIKLMMNTVTKLLGQDQYDYCLIAFDAGEATFRHQILDTYKEGRKKTPQPLKDQMHDCIKALQALGITTMVMPQIEADDLVGSCSQLMTNNQIHSDIYTSDKDLLQLVSPTCTVNLMKTGVSVIVSHTEENFKENFFGLTPNQVIDYKAIIGDTSDCLPGVKGVGPKTGIDLIIKYKNLESIYEHLNELSPGLQNKFNAAKEVSFKCKQMATILTDIFKDASLDEFTIKKINDEAINVIIDKYKLKDLQKYVEMKKTQ